MFPTTSQILNHYLIQLSISLLILIALAAFSLWRILSARAENREGKSDLRPWLFALAGLLIWVAGAYVINAPMIRALLYRWNPQQIAEIRVTQLSGGKSVVINDRNLIASGFRFLPEAVGYSQENERLLPEGYRIEIKLDGASNYSPMSISAHRQTRRGANGVQDVNVVAVMTDKSQSLILSSSPFHSWLRRNIDPLFAPPPLVVP